MMALEEAQDRILNAVTRMGTERVRVPEALHRITAESVRAGIDLPPFDNSAMDGYAIRSGDVALASTSQPVTLLVAGTAAAGQPFEGEVASGHCARVYTGSQLPRGADAVVMQEDTRIEEGPTAKIALLSPVKPWENIRLRGEDVRSGALLIDAGERIHGRHMGLLGAAGVADIAVHRRPRIGILATGSELAEPAAGPLAPGSIYESNRAMIAAGVRQAGAIPRVYPLVKDTEEMTRAALESAFAECDALITSGGVSVGDLDFVKQSLEAIGGQLQYWRVAVKPGKPFVFGRREDQYLFGLPGNPVSAAVTFVLLVRPALLKMQGAADCKPRTLQGVLGAPVANPAERRHFMRVIVDADATVRIAGPQASHHLCSLAAANALLDMPPGASWPAGHAVRVIPLEQ